MRRSIGPSHRVRRAASLFGAVALALSMLPGAGPAGPRPVSAAVPASVTIAGSLQTEAGCSGDWDPACATSHLTYDSNDDVWQGTFTLPAGGYEYKAALDDSWDENYGLHAAPNGANVPLTVASGGPVKFFYDHKSHWATDNVGSVIAVAPGDFQSELGCSGDWDPGCLRSWLEDPDGDGIYTFETTAIPAGGYAGKVALDESWDVNYGQGGTQNGSNIAFTVPVDGTTVTFRYDATSHVLTITAVPPGPGPDNNVELDGLRHDSRDPLYRTPGGAVPAGTPVRIRFRTFHDDVTSVKLRVYDLNASAQRIVAMTPAATDVSCYQAGLEDQSCDFWQTTVTEASPNNLWYRFIVQDGTDTAYYADDTPALDGGAGAPSDDVVDNSYALMAYQPDFTAPSWAKDAVIYQVFPDRFRDGRNDNDLKTGALRYDDPVQAMIWGTKPEGYCRNYADGATNCPWRFDTTPPADSPTKEQPRGRDYFGGDLKGVDQQLDYLKAIGFNTIYFNPIFDAGSNHAYDTQDYFKIDPAFGTQKDFDNLIKHANQLKIRIVLDGVYNHMSSDSPFFDRYGHYPIDGACESATSPYRGWFTFHDVAAGTGTCVGSNGTAKGATYDGWFGFDSIPVLTKSLAAVQQYFVTAPDSVSRYWLAKGAAGWRLDVMGDTSFPDGYWEQFRQVVKAAKSDALIVGELWQKDSTLLRFLRGDRADTTMDYRLRDGILGLLAPGAFDSKGFADSGRILSPSEFASRLLSIREDYPDAAYYSLMNLLDSHDTERLLWTLTPGTETTADKEANAANVSEGKRRAALASLIQFTQAGAPTVYYGDEVGITGDDDPDDRRTYPWADLGGSPDLAVKADYTALANLRRELTPLRTGALSVLLADDASDTLAYGLRTGTRAAVVAINRDNAQQTLTIPVAGWLPDGTTLTRRYGVGTASTGSATVGGGTVVITLPALSGVLLDSGTVDLTPPAKPTNLHVTSEGNSQVSLAWNAVAGAAGYDIFRSPLSGGGFVKVNDTPHAGTSLTDTGLDNGRTYYYVVRSLDAAGNASGASNEVAALPHLAIGWANLQWPPTLNHTISAVNRTDSAYGQVWIDGATNQPGPTPSLRAQLGFGTDGSDPSVADGWTWVDAAFNRDAGNNDEFVASLLPEVTGTFDYAYRYTTTNGRDWVYADLDGIPYSPSMAGALTVTSSGDTSAPSTPANLDVVGASPSGIDLVWDASTDDTLVYGYEVRRSDASGGPYTTIGLTTTTSFTDANVTEGATYYYVVRAVDSSFNRSGASGEASATATLRTVTLQFNVTVPASTDGTGRSVYIAGFLDRLDGGHPQWDPAGVALTPIDATHWTITFTGKESTSIEYKYALGSWDFVEKDGSCAEVGNRQLTLTYGSNGTQTVNDTVGNWRNVAPCGN